MSELLVAKKKEKETINYYYFVCAIHSGTNFGTRNLCPQYINISCVEQ
jgi:hypothetical protein